MCSEACVEFNHIQIQEPHAERILQKAQHAAQQMLATKMILERHNWKIYMVVLYERTINLLLKHAFLCEPLCIPWEFVNELCKILLKPFVSWNRINSLCPS